MVRAQVGYHLAPQADHGPVLFDRQLHFVDLGAALNRAHDILPARFGPLHRTAELPGQVGQQGLFPIHIELGAESSSDFRRDHAHAVLRDSQHDRNLRAHQVRDLGGGPEGDRFLPGVILCGHRAALHGNGSQALVDQALGDNLVRARKRFFDVATPFLRKWECECYVVFKLGVHLGGVGLHRRFNVDCRRQRFVLDLHEVGRVPARIPIRRDNGDHRLSHETDRIDRKHGLFWELQPRNRRGARNGTDEMRDVLAGQYLHHPRRRLRRLRVDGNDVCVGVDAAYESHIEHSRQLDVIDVSGRSRDQARILCALHSGSHRRSFGFFSCCPGHGFLLSRCRRSNLLALLARGVLDCVHDVLVARAAAKVALQSVTDFPFGGIWILVEQVARSHDHSGRAEAALKAMLLPKTLLNRMQVSVLCQALDRGDLPSVGLHREERARLDCLSVHKHRTGAADAGLAADMGSCEAQILAQVMHEKKARLDGAFPFLAVYSNANVAFHVVTSQVCRANKGLSISLIMKIHLQISAGSFFG